MKVVLSPLQRLRGDSASPVAQFIYVFKCIPSFVTFTASQLLLRVSCVTKVSLNYPKYLLPSSYFYYCSKIGT